MLNPLLPLTTYAHLQKSSHSVILLANHAPLSQRAPGTLCPALNYWPKTRGGCVNESNRALGLEEAAYLLGIEPVSLRDKRFRVRIGLPATKIGRCLRFQQADVDRVLRRGRERLPVLGGARYEPA
jgi:hypothetical protein